MCVRIFCAIFIERVTGESDLPVIADVASSDDVAPADVSSGSTDALQTGIRLLLLKF